MDTIIGKATKMDTELLADGSKIYTFTMDDKSTESFILSTDEIKDFINKKYDEKKAAGEVFDADHYEEKREEFILKNINLS